MVAIVPLCLLEKEGTGRNIDFFTEVSYAAKFMDRVPYRLEQMRPHPSNPFPAILFMIELHDELLSDKEFSTNEDRDNRVYTHMSPPHNVELASHQHSRIEIELEYQYKYNPVISVGKTLV